jgi:hypothetical protein
MGFITRTDIIERMIFLISLLLPSVIFYSCRNAPFVYIQINHLCFMMLAAVFGNSLAYSVCANPVLNYTNFFGLFSVTCVGIKTTLVIYMWYYNNMDTKNIDIAIAVFTYVGVFSFITGLLRLLYILVTRRRKLFKFTIDEYKAAIYVFSFFFYILIVEIIDC